MVINEYKNNQDVLKNVDYNDRSLNISLYIYDNYFVRYFDINVIDNYDLFLNDKFTSNNALIISIRDIA